MRIVYISSSEYPHPTANGVQVVKQCNAFSRAVDEVLLLARMAHGSKETLDAIRHAYLIDDGVRIRFMKVGNSIPSFIKSLIYPFWAAFNTPYSAECVYGRHLLSLVVVGLFKRPCSLIFECHAPPRGYLKFALRFVSCLSSFRQVVAISDALKDILLTQFPSIESSQITVAHDGCDPQFEVKFDPTLLSVGYVGGMYKGRGLELIVEIASRLAHIDFHIVGGTLDQLKLIVKREIPLNIHCHGRVSQADLRAEYSKFSVALAPYAAAVYTPDGIDTSKYMSPLKIFEYMGWKKVVLASDLPVLREVLSNNENALLLPAEDPDAWEDAIRSLSNESLAIRLASNAYRDATERFSWVGRAGRILKLV